MTPTLAGYREWVRLRLAIRTPKEQGVAGAQEGAEPPWQMEPSNYKLNSIIKAACDIVNREVGLAGDSAIRGISVAAQTANGPLSIDLSAIPGYRDREVIAVRRAWWNDGSTNNKLTPVILSDLDRRNSQYANDAPATPMQFALEGYTLFLDPPPSAAGTLNIMCTTGAIAPLYDGDSFEGIPEAYDEAILYIAIVEYGKTVPGNAEMAARAQAFTSDAASGLERLKAWFNGNNEEAQSYLMYDATGFRRNARWR